MEITSQTRPRAKFDARDRMRGGVGMENQNHDAAAKATATCGRKISSVAAPLRMPPRSPLPDPPRRTEPKPRAAPPSAAAGKARPGGVFHQSGFHMNGS